MRDRVRVMSTDFLAQAQRKQCPQIQSDQFDCTFLYLRRIIMQVTGLDFHSKLVVSCSEMLLKK